MRALKEVDRIIKKFEKRKLEKEQRAKPPTFGKFDESLSHFECPVCNKWWSIGDAPDRDHWFCPWCGIKLIKYEPEPEPKPKVMIGVWGEKKERPEFTIDCETDDNSENRQDGRTIESEAGG